MAVLYITEYATIGTLQGGLVIQAPSEPPLAEQTVVIGVTSLQSAAFNAKTTFVELHADAVCSVSFGTNPTATAANRRMAANQTTDRSVPMNQSFKVAVITNS